MASLLQRFSNGLEEAANIDTAVTLTFTEFVNRVNPRYVWYPHVQQLANILQQVADGEIDRLMVFMPPPTW